MICFYARASFLLILVHEDEFVSSFVFADYRLRLFPALQEAALATRIAEAVISRLPVLSHGPTARKQYVREREAADYMGIKVSTLRAWRLLRSKNGPPFTRVGRMVMYPMVELETHMRAGLVPRRG